MNGWIVGASLRDTSQEPGGGYSVAPPWLALSVIPETHDPRRMDLELEGKKIAVFVAKMFEDLELWYPALRLREAGATVDLVGPEVATYTGKHGVPATADRSIHEVSAQDYDAVIIPGGYSPDHMRREPRMVEVLRELHDAGGLVATICHGGWMLASARVLEGRKVTSFYAIRDDLENAGARWVDEEVVVDGNLVTSRTPADLPAFCRTIIQRLADAG